MICKKIIIICIFIVYSQCTSLVNNAEEDEEGESLFFCIKIITSVVYVYVYHII